ncbi:hypothetical protein [Anaerotignum sp.]
MKFVVMMLIGMLLYAASKWAIYRLSVMAILLYFAELRMELPDAQTIQKYRIKVVKKIVGIKEC